MTAAASGALRIRAYVLDDSPKAVDRLCRALALGGCRVYSVAPDTYQRPGASIDDFFHSIFTAKVWVVDEGDPVALQETLSDGPAIVFVHANLKTSPGSQRTGQEGADVLKHIRLTPELGAFREVHAAVYSFERREALLRRKPANLILHSRGVTFLRLPEAFDVLSDGSRLREWAGRKEDLGTPSFKAFVHCDYRPSDEDHAFSNWWGVRQVKLSSRAAHGNRRRSFPRPVEEKLRELRNKQALYLDGSEESAYIAAMPAGLRSSIIEAENWFDDRCAQLETTPRVLYLDDECAIGWRDLLRDLIYNAARAPGDYFRSIDRFPDPIDEAWVCSRISEFTPDLVLLDLRLQGGRDIGIPVAETSGARAARLIREAAPGLPIIMMTASNKAWTFEEMMKLGVDGYWIKEGIGAHTPPVDTVVNYHRLLTLIKTALGDEYQFLRRFADAVACLMRKSQCWWEQFTWPPPSDANIPAQTQADRGRIFSQLLNVLTMLRQYLHLFHMGYGFRGGAAEQFWRTALLVQMAKTFEMGHAYALLPVELQGRHVFGGRYDRWGRITEPYRQDWFAQRLYASRNKAAHAGTGMAGPTGLQLRDFLSATLAWLSVAPVLPAPPPQRPPHPEDVLAQNQTLMDLYRRIADHDTLDLY